MGNYIRKTYSYEEIAHDFLSDEDPVFLKEGKELLSAEHVKEAFESFFNGKLGDEGLYYIDNYANDRWDPEWDDVTSYDGVPETERPVAYVEIGEKTASITSEVECDIDWCFTPGDAEDEAPTIEITGLTHIIPKQPGT